MPITVAADDLNFMFPVAIEGTLSVCWFVDWTTLTLVITFEPFEIEILFGM